jgi:hypothetical protein
MGKPQNSLIANSEQSNFHNQLGKISACFFRKWKNIEIFSNKKGIKRSFLLCQKMRVCG